MSSLKIYTAQFTPKLGDIAANTQAILDLACELAATNQADLLILPELALTGAGLEDLLFKPSFLAEVEVALAKLATATKNKKLGIVLGYPKQQAGKLYNAVGLLYEGKVQGEYFKQQLNSCLNERRYFTAGDLAENNTSTQPIEFNSYKLGLLIGEDLQQTDAIKAAYAEADLLIAVSASPWHEGLHLERLKLAQTVSQQTQLPLIFCNQIGGQGEVVFDGASFALTANGEVLALAPALEEASLSLIFLISKQNKQLSSPSQQLANWPDKLAYLYGVLVLGLKSYVNNRGFKGVVLGMSGGLDSALSAAIAVDALGANRVLGIMLPYHYTAAISQEDAAEQAQLMSINFEVMPIAPLVESFTQVLNPCFASLAKQETPASSSQADTTEENLQARSRGVLLMALSNKLGLMLLTTSNKSEMAVGYCTLYGDMAGGFNALKDVYKTKVIKLCTWRNSQGYVIPQRVIDRPPSAELAPNQLDENTLPPYPVLDALLAGYLENDLSAEELIAKGFNAEEVNRILRLVDINEHKRRQAAPGIQVTPKPFGLARRYPL